LKSTETEVNKIIAQMEGGGWNVWTGILLHFVPADKFWGDLRD
jgi:hypothetical protein